MSNEIYSDERVSQGMRIKYYKFEHLLQSQKVYSDGNRQIVIQIDTTKMEFYFVDPVTGFTHYEHKEPKISNLEVLQRHVKKQLVHMLKIHFEKEVRNTKNVE